jgi:hypothetical protein
MDTALQATLQAYITKFNFHIDEFLEQLIYIGTDPDIELYRSFFNNFVITETNKHLPIEIYCKEIILSPHDENNDNYADYIKKRNETRFLSMNITSENDKYGGDEMSLTKIFEYRDKWLTLDEENREIIFDYLVILTELADKYIRHKYPNKN